MEWFCQKCWCPLLNWTTSPLLQRHDVSHCLGAWHICMGRQPQMKYSILQSHTRVLEKTPQVTILHLAYLKNIPLTCLLLPWLLETQLRINIHGGCWLCIAYSGVTRWGWGRPPRVTPPRGVTPEWNEIFLVAEFRKNTGQTTSEGASCEEMTAIIFAEAMTKKGRQFFLGENGWHCQLPPRVTPTLVTPLHSHQCMLNFLILGHVALITEVLTDMLTEN